MERIYPMCQKCFHGEVKFSTADSWEAGLTLMRAGTIDVAIVDLTLPPMHKEQTLAEIERECANLPPLIVLTGNDSDELRRLSILSGAEDFLNKQEVMRHPEVLCERVYIAYLRRNRETLRRES